MDVGGGYRPLTFVSISSRPTGPVQTSVDRFFGERLRHVCPQVRWLLANGDWCVVFPCGWLVFLLVGRSGDWLFCRLLVGRRLVIFARHPSFHSSSQHLEPRLFVNHMAMVSR